MRQLPWKTTVSRYLDSRHLLVGTVGAPRQAQGLRSCMCACVGGSAQSPSNTEGARLPETRVSGMGSSLERARGGRWAGCGWLT